MIRKFKHKKEPSYLALGDELNGKGEPIEYKLKFKEFDESTIGYLPVDIVENSNDWQEITNELVKGRWYKDCNYIGRWDGKTQCGSPILNDVIRLSDSETVIGNKIAAGRHQLSEATPDEIHQALDAIRIEKGLVGGVNIYETTSGLKRQISQYPKITYDYFNDIVFISEDEVISLYEAGKWATKIEPILVTEDGYKIYSGEQKIFDANTNVWQVLTIKAGIHNRYENSNVFYHKENAQAYIENNKPRFSKADLEYLEQECKNAEVNNSIKKAIENLKQSKK